MPEIGSSTQIYPQTHESWLRDDAWLWRYVPLKTLFLYLTGKIFVPAIETLRRDDPFEGEFHFSTVLFNGILQDRYGDRVINLQEWISDALYSAEEHKHIELNKKHPNITARIFEEQYFKFLRKTRYAWCWFQWDRESAAMWNTYGKHGVAVRTTVGKLNRILARTGRAFKYGQMRYIPLTQGKARDSEFKRSNAHDAAFLLMPHFLKRKEYESEKEVRFVTSAPDCENNLGLLFEAGDPVDWISKISLWPGLKPVEEAALKEVVAQLSAKTPCACSDLFGRKRSSHFRQRWDKMIWTQWRNDGDGIPTELKQL